jgi:hypothetical protein
MINVLKREQGCRQKVLSGHKPLEFPDVYLVALFCGGSISEKRLKFTAIFIL